MGFHGVSHHDYEYESDLLSVVHAEIDRLPERHRLPMVLCDLEGLTYEQAADRLRWTVPAQVPPLAGAERLKNSAQLCRGLAAPALGGCAGRRGCARGRRSHAGSMTVVAAIGGAGSSRGSARNSSDAQGDVHDQA